MLVKHCPDTGLSEPSCPPLDCCNTSTPHRIKIPSSQEYEEDQRSQLQQQQHHHHQHQLQLKTGRRKPVATLSTTALAAAGIAGKKPPAPRASSIVNHKLTEFFPVRRSIRKCKRAVLEEKQRDLENKVLCGVEDGLQIKHFVGKGRGIVTTKNFAKGEFVVEYIGELIDMVTAKKRETKYAKDKNTGCYMYYFQHRNQQYCVDATAESDKLGRLVNHSRNGNLATRIVEVGSVPHLVLIAKEDIPAGTEISYDYGDRSRESIRNHPWLAM